MVKVRYFSFIAKTTGVKQEIITNVSTIKDLMMKIADKYPRLADLFEADNPDLAVMMNGKDVILPTESDKQVKGEVIFSPIVAGG